MSHLTNSTQINTTSHVLAIDPNASVVREREFLFQMGDQLDGIYRVNSGCVKLSRSTEDGEKQILGFYMSGDLIGLDALANGFSHSAALVLETANVSLIPFETILNKDTSFDHHSFMHQLGVNFNRDNDHTMMLSQSADRRLAWFITTYSDGLAKRGMLADEFRMPMTGTDLASYLGMALETLSREMGRFCKQGLIIKNNRDIELLDVRYLKKIAGGENTDEEKSIWISRINGIMGQQQSALSH